MGEVGEVVDDVADAHQPLAHAVGDLADAVPAVRLVEVDVPVVAAVGVVDLAAVVVADQRVPRHARQRVSAGLPQVRLLGDDAQQDLDRDPAPSLEGERGEHLLRRPRGEPRLLPVRRACGLQVVDHRLVGRPLHLAGGGLVDLRMRVVARHRAGGGRLGGGALGGQRPCRSEPGGGGLRAGPAARDGPGG